MKKRGKNGRPTEFSVEKAAKMINFIRSGSYVETAAAAAGIAKSTYYAWLKLGARKGEGPEYDFSNAVEQAQADAELRDLGIIDQAARGVAVKLGPDGKALKNPDGSPVVVPVDGGPDWKASAWRLERKFPRRWGRLERHELTGDEGGAIKFEDTRAKLRAIFKDPEARAAARLIQKKLHDKKKG